MHIVQIRDKPEDNPESKHTQILDWFRSIPECWYKPLLVLRENIPSFSIYQLHILIIIFSWITSVWPSGCTMIDLSQ